MKPQNVLEYQSPISQPKQDWSALRFGFALILSFVELLLSVLLCNLMLANSSDSPRNDEAMLGLLLFGVPIFFGMLVITAVTIALTFREGSKPLSWGGLTALFLPQVIAVLLPVILVLSGVHA